MNNKETNETCCRNTVGNRPKRWECVLKLLLHVTTGFQIGSCHIRIVPQWWQVISQAVKLLEGGCLVSYNKCSAAVVNCWKRHQQLVVGQSHQQKEAVVTSREEKGARGKGGDDFLYNQKASMEKSPKSHVCSAAQPFLLSASLGIICTTCDRLNWHDQLSFWSKSDCASKSRCLSFSISCKNVASTCSSSSSVAIVLLPRCC